MIKQLHKKLVGGEITSQELTESYLERIKKQKDLFAYLTVSEDVAMKQAKKVDEKIQKGEKIELLEGIPGAIKDMICTKSIRTTAASKILDNYIAPYDATVIEKLKKVGAVFLGKTNMDEFAMGSSTENSGYGPTKNPEDKERVPGGSSGGSAAAVAADQAVWALGTDTGGSIRQPASFCGIVGLKPTYGRVSRYGAIAMASSLDQIGPMAKTVEDVAIVLSAIHGHDPKDATSAHSGGNDYTMFLKGDVSGKKMGIVKDYLDKLPQEGKKSMEKVIKKYESMGVEIVDVKLPNVKYALPTYYIIMPSEISSNLARYDGIRFGMRANDQEETKVNFDPENRTLLENYLDSRRFGFGEEPKRRIMLGTYALSSGYYDAYYVQAQKMRALLKKDFEKAFSQVDFILTPTAPSSAWKFGEKSNDPIEMYLEDVFTVTANIVGIPGISFPAPEVEKDGKKLPFGFQILGKWFDEEGILDAAYSYEISK